MYWLWIICWAFWHIFLMRGPFFLIFSPASPENNANRSGWPDFWLVFPIKGSVARGMSLKRACNVLTLNHLLSILAYLPYAWAVFPHLFTSVSWKQCQSIGLTRFLTSISYQWSVARGMSLRRACNVLTLNHLLGIFAISSLCVGRFSSSFHQRLLKTMPIDRVDQISD